MPNFTEGLFVRLTGDVNSGAHYPAGDVLGPEEALYKGFFLVGEEDVGLWQAEYPLKAPEMYEWLLVGCGDEYGLLSYLRHTRYCQVVEVGDEYECVVIILVVADVLNCGRGIGPLLLEPYLLCGLIRLSC